MYGHVAKLAEEIQKGAASVEGVEAVLWQVYIFYLPIPYFFGMITHLALNILPKHQMNVMDLLILPLVPYLL